MNTITIELSAEDRSVLQRIVTQLDAILDVLVTAGTPFPATLESTAEPEGQMTTEEAAPVEEAPAEKPVKVVELADIQKKVVELSAAGKKAEVRDIVTKYATRVSAIPEDKTAEVWEKLTALEG